MTTYIRRLALFSAVLSLCACGAGPRLGGGKEGAAAALFAASSPAKSAGGTTPFGQGIGINSNVTVSCQDGGKAQISVTQNIDTNTGSSVQQDMVITYDNCSNSRTTSGDAVVLNGTMKVTQAIQVGSTTGSVSQKLVGSVRFSGGIDDQLDADITQTVDWAQLGAQSGSVSITLNGTLKTSSASYDFQNEAVNIQAGVLIAEPRS